MKGEEDYRPLFENFVYDLLATVNKPEWPAAELLLSLLGRLLVSVDFCNKDSFQLLSVLIGYGWNKKKKRKVEMNTCCKLPIAYWR